MADLKTDYKDDVLDTEVNELRKYQMIQNEDGTVSFVDVTEYLQVGDSFGSADVNAITLALEEFEGVRNLKTYTNVTQLGLTQDNTLTEIFNAMPSLSQLVTLISQGKSLGGSLPNSNTAELIVTKGNHERAIAVLTQYANGVRRINHCYGGEWKGWETDVLSSNMTDFIKTMEVTGPSTTLGAEGTGESSKAISFTYTVPDGYKAIGIVGFYTGNTEVYTLRVTTNRMDLRNKNTVSVTVTPKLTVLLAKTF